MFKNLLILSLLLTCLSANGQVSLDYYLPREISYNKSIPTPKQFTGYEVGEWTLAPDKLYYYMLELARVSDRAIWEEYGKSYEGRPLGELIISSPGNIKNLEQLRQQHILLCDPAKSDKSDTRNMPVFIKLGYGIHGNEASGPNSSVLTAYYLIAGEGKKIDELLNNEVILIDPTLNPDGMQRYSTWVNQTRSLNNNPDPNSWEFSEPWPGGRTNHYWFDLNRDYLMLQHPESTGRVEAFYRWRPNIITDHHEMQANSTFFFQPGVPSRNNPLTPAENQDLTAEIAKYHEKYLDSIGSLYFSEEGYDDFYIGKGSSYPDIHGSVGILFEQAGVKGHLKETPGGLLSFPFAIKNQLTVSLSTLEAGLNMRIRLLESQKNFYNDAIAQADKYPVKAYVFTCSEDKGRVRAFIENLLYHHIKVFRLAKSITRNGTDFNESDGYIVPLRQNEYRFIRSLFEPVTKFTDSVFYDISTWVLPMSFNLPYAGIMTQKEMEGLTGSEILDQPASVGKLIAGQNIYAYLFEWNEYYSPKALYELQKAGIAARVATKKFTVSDVPVNKEFSYGTILIPVSGQKLAGMALNQTMDDIAKDCGITIFGVSTGLTAKGIDLGSNSFTVLSKPSVLMVAGDGTSSSDAGEIWHLLDTRFGMPVTMVTSGRLASVDLDNYNVLIITGSPDISGSGIENIRIWNRRGGTIIAYGNANSWLVKNKLAEIEFVPPVTTKINDGTFVNMAEDRQVQLIPGSIFETKLDLTNPLCYGYSRVNLPVFKTSTTAAKKDKNVYGNPVIYTLNPLLSGYCTRENIERIKGTSFASVHGNRIISIYDNTNFRAIWYGTNKIFMNAIFFGQLF